MINPVAALYLRVTNLEKSLAFYSTILGISFQKTAPQIAMGKLDNLTVVLHEASTTERVVSVSFTVGDVEHLLRDVIVAGGSVEMDKHEEPVGLVVNLKDPDGLPLEFVQLK